MNPDFAFDSIQVNKFTSHEQCQMHLDRKNRGESRWAMMGSCKGGGLMLADGRHSRRKRPWREYKGAEVAHCVEPFQGERLTCILYSKGEGIALKCNNAVKHHRRRVVTCVDSVGPGPGASDPTVECSSVLNICKKFKILEK